MRSTLLVAVLAGLVAGSPAPQAFDFNAVQNAPSPSATGPALTANAETITYDPASATSAGSAAATAVASADSSAVQKRGKTYTVSSSTTTSATVSSTSACPTTPEAGTYCGFINPEDACAPQPDGYGPKVTPDTTDAFLAYQPFHDLALRARTPYGYAQTFKNLNASVSANSYLGLHTLSSYDTLSCSQLCDNTTLCTGFNLYIERDPSLNPSANCTNPSSITNFKCTLWGSGVEPAAANNFGGYRGIFQVVIAGSDGYEKTNTTVPTQPPGCGQPKQCPVGVVINKPKTCMGKKFFPGPYDINVCAEYAKDQNKYNEAHASQWKSDEGESDSPLMVKQFNSYMVKKDGVAQGTYCALHSKSYQPKDCDYQPGWQQGHFWGAESSCVVDVYGSEGGDD